MSTEHPPDRAEAIKKLGELIKGIKYAMLTTTDHDGMLHSRPMATQNEEFDGSLWFFTRASAPKVDEVANEHKVNVSYSKPNGQSFVSVSGTARLVRDQAKNKEFWTPAMKAWFPKGPEDPETALLKVDVDKAEYWDSAPGPIVIAIGYVKAAVTGKPYHPGENEKLSL